MVPGHLMVVNMPACITIAVEPPGAGSKAKLYHVVTCGQLDTTLTS
jgi:hypothetical protein